MIGTNGCFLVYRIQEKCQPRYDAGYDEDRFVYSLLPRPAEGPRRLATFWSYLTVIPTGHVERTNDRDYEVEERYGSLL